VTGGRIGARDNPLNRRDLKYHEETEEEIKTVK
jgi:hypothetical protein